MTQQNIQNKLGSTYRAMVSLAWTTDTSEPREPPKLKLNSFLQPDFGIFTLLKQR